MIGITAAFTWGEDRETALLAMSFIVPDYRRRGLSRMLYDARLAWIRQQPQFKRIIVSHRASNQASARAIQRYGFVPTGRSLRNWPDGSSEDEIQYELRISN
jgi:RimJ/RimL family protein N-acetyltransferase